MSKKEKLRYEFIDDCEYGDDQDILEEIEDKNNLDQLCEDDRLCEVVHHALLEMKKYAYDEGLPLVESMTYADLYDFIF